MQGDDGPSLLPMVPIGHGMHSDPVPIVKVPLAQAVHGAVPPLDDCPSGQGLQMAPSSVVPAGQLKHDAMDEAPANEVVPAGQAFGVLHGSSSQ